MLRDNEENRIIRSVKPKGRSTFDPKIFLAKVGEGRTITDYQKNGTVFSQGDAADAIFYIQKGKVKLTVVSRQGKEAVIGIFGPGEFFGEGCLAVNKNAWQPLLGCRRAR